MKELIVYESCGDSIQFFPSDFSDNTKPRLLYGNFDGFGLDIDISQKVYASIPQKVPLNPIIVDGKTMYYKLT